VTKYNDKKKRRKGRETKPQNISVINNARHPPGDIFRDYSCYYLSLTITKATSRRKEQSISLYDSTKKTLLTIFIMGLGLSSGQSNSTAGWLIFVFLIPY
jgi:hypothetical protein